MKEKEKKMPTREFFFSIPKRINFVILLFHVVER